MTRKRVTQVFPFLLPLRQWQRKRLFYLGMRVDGNKYAREKADALLPHPVFEAASPLVNRDSGFALQYQFNKIHNLKLAAKTLDRVLIRPKETFSFWQLVRRADRDEKYKDGLHLVDGKIVGAYGGGLCQLSSLLFWLFLHTPLTVTERHGHAIACFPPAAGQHLPCGVDATISEGWLDLKVRNETENTFQLAFFFDEDEETMYGRILAQNLVNTEYMIFNPVVSYRRQGGKIYQQATVYRTELNTKTLRETEKFLYVNRCEIAYALPDEIKVEERGVS